MKKQEQQMTEKQFIAKFKKAGFELYKTKDLKPKLDAFAKLNDLSDKEKASARIEYVDNIIAMVDDIDDYTENDLLSMGFNKGVEWLQNHCKI